MSRKLKFKPEITRVKLDPEQAVLSCACFGATQNVWTGTNRKGSSSVAYCNAGSGRLVGTTTQYICTANTGSTPSKTNSSGTLRS